jgi:hypothetical protein
MVREACLGKNFIQAHVPEPQNNAQDTDLVVVAELVVEEVEE